MTLSTGGTAHVQASWLTRSNSCVNGRALTLDAIDLQPRGVDSRLRPTVDVTKPDKTVVFSSSSSWEYSNSSLGTLLWCKFPSAFRSDTHGIIRRAMDHPTGPRRWRVHTEAQSAHGPAVCAQVQHPTLSRRASVSERRVPRKGYFSYNAVHTDDATRLHSLTASLPMQGYGPQDLVTATVTARRAEEGPAAGAHVTAVATVNGLEVYRSGTWPGRLCSMCLAITSQAAAAMLRWNRCHRRQGEGAAEL